MAHTKQTPRKQVGDFVPARAPTEATWAFLPPAEFHSSGLQAGELPRKLRTILKGLGYQEAIVYKGIRTPLSNHGYAWMVEITIFEKNPDDDDSKVSRIHSVVAPRETFAAEICDPARQALSVLCAEYHGVFFRLRRTTSTHNVRVAAWRSPFPPPTER